MYRIFPREITAEAGYIKKMSLLILPGREAVHGKESEMSRCANSRHQLLSNDCLAQGTAPASGREPGALDPADGVLFVYYGTDALVITAAAGDPGEHLALALQANPRPRRISA
jgi:hypothetical protein